MEVSLPIAFLVEEVPVNTVKLPYFMCQISFVTSYLYCAARLGDRVSGLR